MIAADYKFNFSNYLEMLGLASFESNKGDDESVCYRFLPLQETGFSCRF
jgi:hypothetical protein